MDPSLHKSPDLKIESFPDIPLLPASKKAKLTKFKIKFVFCIQRPKNLFMFFINILASEEILHVVHK